MADVTINGTTYTTDSRGYITGHSGSGGAGSLGLNIASIAGYTPGSSGSSGSSRTTYTPPSTVVGPPAPAGTATTGSGYTVVGNGYSGSSGGGGYAPPTSNNTSQAFTDFARQNNINYNYDAPTNTLTINGQTYKNGYVPGLSLINGRNYVTDPSMFSPSISNTGAKAADVPMVNSNNGLDTEKIQALLAAMTPKYEIPEMPKYELPNLDISSLITPTQGPAITANAADTVYLPTTHFKNRVLQAQQAQATLANQNYQNQLNAWGSQVDAIQNQATAQRAALSAILPYIMQTADQQAADELQKTLDASKLERQDWYIQSLKDEAALKQRLTESQIAENNAQAAKAGKSGGGGTKTTKPTQTDRYNNAAGDAYSAVDAAVKSGKSYDQIKKSILSQANALKQAGVDYNSVLKYLDSLDQEGYIQTSKSKSNNLNERPLWQKAVDAVIPGGQFR